LAGLDLPHDGDAALELPQIMERIGDQRAGRRLHEPGEHVSAAQELLAQPLEPGPDASRRVDILPRPACVQVSRASRQPRFSMDHCAKSRKTWPKRVRPSGRYTDLR